MIITLMGLDGSGKTTQARELLLYFEKQGKKVCYIHWLKFYPSFIKSFSRQAHEIPFKKASPSSTSSSFSSPGVFYIIMRIFLSIFNAAFVCIVILFNLARGKRVILDRCFIDELVQLRYRGLNKRIFTFFLKITPVTKTMFYLEISPQMALQREGGHNIDYFQKKADFYKEVVKLKKIKKIQVSTQEETFQQILENLV